MDYINNQANFSVSFLHAIHFRVQSFFKSCVIASEVEDIRFDFLNFNDLLRTIEMHNYQIVIPNWFVAESLKSNKNDPNHKRDLDDPNPNPNPKKSKPVINESVDPACALAPNETYRFVFHKNNMQNLTVPKVNGTDICLKFHVEGKCKTTCSRAKTHTRLNAQNLIDLRKLVKSVKEKYNSFRANRRQDRTTEPEGETNDE